MLNPVLKEMFTDINVQNALELFASNCESRGINIGIIGSYLEKDDIAVPEIYVYYGVIPSDILSDHTSLLHTFVTERENSPAGLIVDYDSVVNDLKDSIVQLWV